MAHQAADLSDAERGGVIRSRKAARVPTCGLAPRTLWQARRWIAAQRTDRMARCVETHHRAVRP